MPTAASTSRLSLGGPGRRPVGRRRLHPPRRRPRPVGRHRTVGHRGGDDGSDGRGSRRGRGRRRVRRRYRAAGPPATGAVRWSVSLPGEPDWRPVVADETVFVVTTDGVLAAVDPAEGSVSGRREPIADVTAAAFDAGTLYLGGESGRVVALSAPGETGGSWTRRWTYEAGVRVGALAADESGTLVVDQSGTLHRVTDDGERGARVPLVESDYENRCGWLPDHEMLRAAVLDDGRLYVSSMWWVRRFSASET
nr:PQQ-binding-like beta-propeller repeat protein [Halogeometricum sp. CBA1124]